MGRKVYLDEIRRKSGVSNRILVRLCDQGLIPAHRFPGGFRYVWEADLSTVERILSEAGHPCNLRIVPEVELMRLADDGCPHVEPDSCPLAPPSTGHAQTVVAS